MHWISRDGIRANALFIAAKVSIPSSLCPSSIAAATIPSVLWFFHLAPG